MIDANIPMQSKKHELVDVVEEANEWEESRIELIERSERRAWKVAGCASVLATLAVGAVIVMATRFTVEPFLVRENGETGAVDMITRLRDVDVSGNEVRDGYWITQYVRARETYDWWTLDNDYKTVGIMSSDVVGAEYAAQFEGDGALQDEFGQRVRSTVEVVSVVPSHDVATVRFTKTTERISANRPPEVTRWIATIGYTYDTGLKIESSLRLLNPWGFQVMSYRVDPELAGGAS